MIKVLGTRRIFILLVLVGLNAAFAAAAYWYLMPEKLKKERELRTLNSQISTLQTDIDRLQIEFDQLEDQQNEFEVLKERGFFNDQGRRQAEIILERIQKEAGVISAVANIQGGALVDHEEAAKANHKVLTSPISIKVEALDDVDVYRYIFLLERFFPGHLSLKSMNLSRNSDINGTILRGISSGQNPALVKAEMEWIWRTMIPSTTEDSEGRGQ